MQENSLYVQMAGEGIPLIGIHPPLLTSETFRMQLRDLSDVHQVIVPDLRGHGLSTNQEQVSLSYQQLASDLIGMHQSLQLQPSILMGYSTGAGLVIELLHLAPERFLGGIIISGMVHVADRKLARQIRVARFLCRNRLTRSLLLTRTCLLNSSSIAMGLRMHRSGMNGDPDAIASYYSASLAYDGSALLSQIQQPVLLAYGQLDVDFAPYLRQFVDQLPQSHVVLLRGQKHQLPSQAAMDLNQEIRQWSRQFVV